MTDLDPKRAERPVPDGLEGTLVLAAEAAVLLLRGIARVAWLALIALLWLRQPREVAWHARTTTVRERVELAGMTALGVAAAAYIVSWRNLTWRGFLALLAALALALLVRLRVQTIGAARPRHERQLYDPRTVGPPLGQTKRRPRLPWQAVQTGVLVVGPTGVGKTASIVGPALAEAAKHGLGGLIIDRTGGLPLDDYCAAVLDPADTNPNAPTWNPCAEGDRQFAEALYFGDEQHPFFAAEGMAAVTAVTTALHLLDGAAPTPARLHDCLLDPTNIKELRDRLEDIHGATPGGPLPRLRQLASLSDRARDERLAGALTKVSDLASGDLGRLTGGAGPLASVLRAAGPGYLLGARLTARDGLPGRQLAFALLSIYTRAVLSAGQRDLCTLLIADEFADVVRPEIAPYVTQCRQHGGGTIFSLQSIGQLEAVEHGFAATLTSNCRTHIAVCPLGGADANLLSEAWGTRQLVRTQRTTTATPRLLGPATLRTVGAGEQIVDEPFVHPAEMTAGSGYAWLRLTLGRESHRPMRIEL